VIERFSKAETYVDDSIVHTEVVELGEFFAKELYNVLRDVIVGGVFLHGRRIALHVHHDVGRLVLGCDVVDVWVEITAGYVVNDMCSSRKGFLGNFGAEGVHRNEGAGVLRDLFSDCREYGF
jgi:hypothetical protein